MTASKKKTWGALPKEWARFEALGLTGDLLPVVCNPKAKIGPLSKMKKVGKTPSLYNKDGHAVGMGQWTEKTSTKEQVARWKREEDYGICLQTRFVRAFDIDVPDQKKADAIRHFIQTQLTSRAGQIAPVRYREDSGKCLLAFIVHSEELFKRKVEVDGGIIEFLATGQQFVAAGVHQDGQRYKWNWQSSEEFPVISEKKILKVWQAVVDKFGTGEEEGVDGPRKKRDKNAVIVPDATMDYLEKENLVLSYGQEGQAFIECPFKDSHTSESVESATCYFPKGSRGYAQGHFRCLHAHCTGRKDMEFEEALGILDAHFEPIELTAEEREDALPRGLLRDKAGAIKPIRHNVDVALRSGTMAGFRLGYDDFLGDEMIAKLRDDGSFAEWRPVKDTDYSKLMLALERRGFAPLGKDMFRDCLKLEADRMKFDSLQAWFDNIPAWDGKKRVERFLPDYLGVKDSPYARAVGRYLFSALAGRIIHPGCKADMALALVGTQGTGKSTAIAALAPAPEMFEKLNLADKDDDLARKMCGKLICELDELKGLNSRDAETHKSFIARPVETWVKKYEEKTTRYRRRALLLASTNMQQFLADDTGERRWLPFEVCKNGMDFCDIEAIERDKLQLYAEGRALFEKNGVMWQEAEALAGEQHNKFKVVDGRMEILRDWLESDDLEGGKPSDKEYLYAVDILQHALGFRPREIKRGDEMAVSSMMLRLGYKKVRKRIEGNLKWVFIKTKLANSSK